MLPTATRLKLAHQARDNAVSELRNLYAQAEGRDLDTNEQQTEARIQTTISEQDDTIRRDLQNLENEQRSADFFDRLGVHDSGESRTESATAGAWLAAELRDISGDAGVGAAWTPSERSSEVLDLLAAQSVFLASGVQVIRTQRDSLEFPHLTADAASGWVSPGAEITPTDPSGETVTITPEKVAALVALHNEVISDADPDVLDTVGRSLIRSLGLRYDLGAFEGSGISPEITGLKNIDGIQEIEMGTDGASLTNLDPFADALGALETENARGRKAIVMHPRTWKAASKLKEQTSGSNKPLLQESAGSAGQGIRRSIYGVDVYLTSQLSITETQGTSSDATSAYVYDVEEVYAVLRQDVRVELDRSRLFNKDSSELRAVLRGAIAVPNPKAVARITGIV